jgi:hypothetical protein
MTPPVSVLPYDDDYPTCERTYAELRVYTDLDPGRITALLGLQPAPARPKRTAGVDFAGKVPSGIRHAWFLSTEEVVRSRDLRRHLDWLLSRLRQASPGIEEVRRLQGVAMFVTCVWWSASGDGGPTLGVDHMRGLVELGLECRLELAFYNTEPDGP